MCESQYSKKWRQGWQKTRAPLVRLVFLALALFGAVLVPSGCGQRPAVLNEAPHRVTVSEEAAQRLSERVSRALQSRGPFSLSFTDTELTSYLASNVRGLPLSYLAIWFARGQVQFTARLGTWGQPKIQGKLELTCTEGKIQTFLRQVTLNGRPLPRFLLTSAEKALNDALADASLSLRVERIIVDEGLLSVTGTVD